MKQANSILRILRQAELLLCPFSCKPRVGRAVQFAIEGPTHQGNSANGQREMDPRSANILNKVANMLEFNLAGR
jgi:hypothetical protein